MTCGTLLEFCNEDFPVPPRLPPPPPIQSYYFEDKMNSSFYCEFCSNLEASLDPLQKEFDSTTRGTGGLFSPYSQNLTVILIIVAVISATVGSAVTVIWRKWFRCRDGGILSKAFGASHSSHSADISSTPDGRRGSSRAASLVSGSALQNLQKRLSSSSFISRRSTQHHASNIISHGSHLRSGTMSNNTYCECPSSMMMMMCSSADAGNGNNLGLSTPMGSGTGTTASLSPSCLASAPTASTLSISTGGGNVYAELDPVSVQQQHSMAPPLPPFPTQSGLLPFINNAQVNPPLSLIRSTMANQYVLNHKRRQPAPLPPIPPTIGNSDTAVHHQRQPNDLSIAANNALNVNSSNGMPVAPLSTTPNFIVGVNPGGIMPGVIPTVQMEMNDLNDIYYSDLDCKQIQF